MSSTQAPALEAHLANRPTPEEVESRGLLPGGKRRVTTGTVALQLAGDSATGTET